MQKWMTLCALYLGTLYTPLAQADALTQIKTFYRETTSMQADFHQIVTDKNGKKIQEVEGVMALKRPNQFRWDYNKPYEQQIVSDGVQVWLYDVELQQVTVRSLGNAIGSSPAVLLAGDTDIDKKFKLTNASRKDTLAWVSAVPKDKDSGFARILLGLKENQLHEMQLIDSLGQKTQITFTNLVENAAIEDKRFLFTPPKGVDVVGE